MTTKTRKFGIRTLTLILAILMIVYVVPLTVIAENIRASSNATTEEATETTTVIKDAFELTDRREETVKHFRTEDGSIVAVVYPNAVHRQDDSGTWQDIDNRLAEKGSEIATSDARVKFAKKITGNETLFTLHDGNYKLTMSLDGAKKKTAATIINTEEDENASALGKQMTLENLSARILYSNILENVDLEYVVFSNDIKENIIVKAPGGTYTYTFTLQLNNLTAQQAADGSIGLYDRATGERVYVFPRGYMQDAAGTRSTAVSYSLTDHGNGKYTFIATADKGWMNAPERIFPVTIDPPIYTNSASPIVDLEIRSNNTSYNNSTSTTISVSSSYAMYWQLTTLPTLPNSAYITDATFSTYASSANASGQWISVYQVTSAWDSSLTWAQTTASTPSGSLEGVITDDQIINSTGFWTWNILPIAKAWYEGENYGLALWGNESSSTVFRSNDYTDPSYRPQLLITYRDVKGIEDYWTYTSQDLGFAGTGHVNLATGQLTFAIPTLSTLDALMPYTPTLVYNSALAGKQYIRTNAKTAYTSSISSRGFKFNYQETLLELAFTNANGSTTNYFVLADSDGTEHYFYPTTTANTYRDEDGLLLTLTKDASSSTYLITDNDFNQYYFKKLSTTFSGAVSRYCLEAIEDVRGNRISFTLTDDLKLSSVVLKPYEYASGNGIVQLEFAYTGSGDLYLIWNASSGEGVVLRHSDTATGVISTSAGEYLREVVHAHAGSGATVTSWASFFNNNVNTNTGVITVDAVASYTYDSSGRLTSVQNGLSGYRVDYTISNNKVTQIREYGNGSLGQTVSIAYNVFYTTVRTSGSDDVFNNADDLLSTYSFDTSGRAINAYTTNLDGTQLYGASGVQYISGNINAENQIKSAAQTTQRSANYLLDGGFENAGYWSFTGTGNQNGGLSKSGSNSGNLPITATSAASSAYQYVSLLKGVYTLSFYINTHNPGNVTVFVKATSTTNSANSVSKEIPINEYYASGSYAFAELSFTSSPTTTGGKEQFKISVEVSGTVSKNTTVYIDDMMLAKTTGPAEFDMMKAGHFDDSNTTCNEAAFWTFYDDAAQSIAVEPCGSLRGNALSFWGTLRDTCYAEQTFYTASSSQLANYGYSYYEDEPRVYTVSAWAQGSAQSSNVNSLFEIRLVFVYYKGVNQEETVTHTIPLNKYLTEWQYVCHGFTTDPDKGMIKSATVQLFYSGHMGLCTFDDISVTVDSTESVTYTYHDDGRVKSEQRGSQITWYSYLPTGRLFSSVSNDKTICVYGFNDFNELAEVQYFVYQGDRLTENLSASAYMDAEEITSTLYEYSSTTRLLESVSVRGKDSGGNVITYTTGTEYYTGASCHIYGLVKKETDARGETTSYFYHENNGRLLAVTYPDGNGTSYTYDGMGNLTGVNPASYVENTDSYTVNSAVSTNAAYTYDAANRLSSLSANGTSYTFAYDAFGNSTSVGVSGYGALASYTYHSYNGKPDVLTYGNGLKVKYVYDALDRVSEIQYNTGSNGAYKTVYRYGYDAAGRLTSVEDLINSKRTGYRYNTAGQLIGALTSNFHTATNESGIHLSYDEHSRLRSMSVSFDYATAAGAGLDYIGNYYSYQTSGEIAYTSFRGEGMSGRVTPTYDDFGRITNRVTSVTTDNGSFYGQTKYTYRKNGANQTVFVSVLENKIGTSASDATATNTWRYSYDANGNITLIADASNMIQYRYTYDALGQLIREDNKPLGYTYVYTYDSAGNIKSTKRYAYTSGTLGTLQATDNYTYGNSYWKDLLTKYNDQTIEYDEIGNPTKIGTYNAAGYWENYQGYNWQGRQLMSISMGSDTGGEYDVYWYQYNGEGIRIRKSINGYADITYILNGSQIVGERINNEILLLYVYDEAGTVIGLKYRTSSYAEGVYDCYFFEKNLQGDIVAIYNESGTKIGGYKYDAWGKPTVAVESTATTLEQQIVQNYNPFRYRGYYYDIETGLYYLQSRYYNPEWGRFLNADGIGYLGANGDLTSFNLFAYCSNNPVMHTDPSGNIIISAIVVSAVVGAVASFVSSAATQAIFNNGDVDFREAFISAGFGAVSGALTVLCPAGAVVISAGMNALESLTTDIYKITIKEETVDLQTIITNMTVSAAFGAGTGSWGNNFVNNTKYSEAISAIPNWVNHASKGKHKLAVNAMRTAGKDFVGNVGSSLFEGVSVSMLNEGTSLFFDMYLRRPA